MGLGFSLVRMGGRPFVHRVAGQPRWPSIAWRNTTRGRDRPPKSNRKEREQDENLTWLYGDTVTPAHCLNYVAWLKRTRGKSRADMARQAAERIRLRAVD